MSAVRSFSVVTFVAGIVMIILGTYYQCPPPTIEYRYLPRTLDQQMKDAAFENKNFEQMFDGKDIWYRSVTDQKLNKKSIVNR